MPAQEEMWRLVLVTPETMQASFGPWSADIEQLKQSAQFFIRAGQLAWLQNKTKKWFDIEGRETRRPMLHGY